MFGSIASPSNLVRVVLPSVVPVVSRLPNPPSDWSRGGIFRPPPLHSNRSVAVIRLLIDRVTWVARLPDRENCHHTCRRRQSFMFKINSRLVPSALAIQSHHQLSCCRLSHDVACSVLCLLHSSSFSIMASPNKEKDQKKSKSKMVDQTTFMKLLRRVSDGESIASITKPKDWPEKSDRKVRRRAPIPHQAVSLRLRPGVLGLFILYDKRPVSRASCHRNLPYLEIFTALSLVVVDTLVAETKNVLDICVCSSSLRLT